MTLCDVKKYIFILSGVIGILCLVGRSSGFSQNQTPSPRARAKNLIVKITGDLGEGQGNIAGAGIIFNIDNDLVYIVTANHVVRQGKNEARNLQVEFKFLPGFPVPAMLSTYFDRDLDLAVLLVSLKNTMFSAELIESQVSFPQMSEIDIETQLQEGDELYPLGHPAGSDWFDPFNPGRFRTFDGVMVRFEYACQSGHSGGGLFTNQWELVGMLVKHVGPVCEAVSFKIINAKLQSWGYKKRAISIPSLPQNFDNPEISSVEIENPSMESSPRVEASEESPQETQRKRTGSGGPGSCVGVIFPVNKKGEIDRPQPVKVLQQDASVYQDADSLTVIGMLDFNVNLEIMDATKKRVQVRRLNEVNLLGWVDRSDLLCARYPMKGRFGLEQTLYIQTATEVRRDTPVIVKAYPSSDLNKCAGKCQELSRFSGYFVFDIDQSSQSYLLSQTYRLEETDDLVGWISQENGFIWDTAYGLRPREDLVFPEGTILDGQDVSGQERTTCAYVTIEDALEGRNCQPILGGDRWYRYPHRIPILERIELEGKAFYKVILPLPGVMAKQAGNKIKIHPELLGENPGATSLLDMKHIDVFFLIDGTPGMRPYIDAIRGTEEQSGVVQEIVETLQKQEAFKEALFRFGFRVYRTTYTGDVWDGLPLPSDCELTKKEQELNLKTFHQAIAGITTIAEGTDYYESDLLGGINQAIKDLSSCPDYNKLLFIIGDSGYNSQAMRKQGIDPLDTDYLAKKLQGYKIVTFFLQLPYNRTLAEYPDDYDIAYTLFQLQAEKILNKILPSRLLNEKDFYFMTTTDEELQSKIIKGIKPFSNTEAINELILDLRGGTALTAAIQRLQGSAEYNNIPGLFWELVEQGSSKKLGEQYENRIYDIILTGYIPVSDDVVEDVWLKSQDLDTWTDFLRDFEDMSGISGAEQREKFVFAIKDALERVIRKPSLEATGESLKVYLERKGGLPVRDTSVLFDYSIDDLLDPRTVPDCEIDRLASWLNNAKKILHIIYRGDLRPQYTLEPYPGECPHGEKIPYVSSYISTVPFRGTQMRYDHKFQEAHIYWIPEEFLP